MKLVEPYVAGVVWMTSPAILVFQHNVFDCAVFHIVLCCYNVITVLFHYYFFNDA